MRILALDVGEKNIGVAVSDELAWTAQGLPNIKRQDADSDIRRIATLVREYQANEVVVGMPLNLDASLGKKAKEVTSFLEELKKALSVPIKVWDERFSTVEAEKTLLEADLSRAKRKRKLDRLSAQLILQGYLDSRSNEHTK